MKPIPDRTRYENVFVQPNTSVFISAEASGLWRVDVGCGKQVTTLLSPVPGGGFTLPLTPALPARLGRVAASESL